jgi:hypothetical protein
MLLGLQRISSRFYESFFLCEKSRKGVRREECENSREIVKRKGVDVFLGRSSGKISLACGNLCSEGHPSYPLYAIGMAKDL